MGFYKNIGSPKKKPIYYDELRKDMNFLGAIPDKSKLSHVNEYFEKRGLTVEPGDMIGIKEDTSLWCYTEIVSSNLQVKRDWIELPYTICI